MKKPYFITKPAIIERDENTLRIITKSQKIKVPIHGIDSVYLLGGGSVSSGAFKLLSFEGIPIHIFDFHGFYEGTFYPKIHNVSGEVLVKQVLAYHDKEKRLELAKKFVEGAANNMLRNLRRWNRNHEVLEFWDKISTLVVDVSMSDSIQKLMSIEARIRKVYYAGFSRCIPIEFNKRTFHPPKNPMNALISFGNSLIYATTLSQIFRTRLDPRVSFLHEPAFRRFSLVYDVSEIFKPLIVDRLIVDLVNHNIITESCFDKQLNYTYLNDKGRRKFVERYNEKLQKTIHHKTLNRKVSYQRLILLELYKLEKHILGIRGYEPFMAWW